MLLSPKQAFKNMLVTWLHLILFPFSVPLIFTDKKHFPLPRGTMAYLYFMQHRAILLLLNIGMHLAPNTKMPRETLKSSQRKNPYCM